MDETPIDGVKFSEFSSATPGSSDDVVGLHNGENARFSLSGIIQLIRQGFANIFVPVSRTINGKSLNSNISLDADDVGARADTWMPTAADVGAAKLTQVGSIALSSSWSGAGPYSQTVVVTRATVTANSKVDIQLTAAQIASLISTGVTGMVIENNDGTLTAWAVGAQTGAMTVQVTVMEVE